MATYGFALLSAVLGLRLVTAPTPAPIERVVVVKEPASREWERPEVDTFTPVAHAPDSPAPPVTSAPYLWLRHQVLNLGADALPNLPATRPEPPAEPLRLRGLTDTGMPSQWFFPIS
jgi:hypothetical protein